MKLLTGKFRLLLNLGKVASDVEIAAKGGADIIVVDGMQGGTGAGPDVIMEHSGIPSLAAIVEADQALKN